jgi:RsiW-degrading membrane proteinase PrsW (M82 family)/multisubunit Na+/H+ antiporter MnhG subunit
MKVLLALLLVAWALAVGWSAFRRLAKGHPHPVRRYVYAAGVGGLFALLTTFAERAVLAWTGLDFDVKTSGAGGALMATFLLAAPLEEAAKVLVVWPLYRARRLSGPRLGMLYAALIGAGFAAVESVLWLWTSEQPLLTAVRCALGVLPHVFCAGAWGYALGAGRRGSRWFSSVWGVAVLLHGLFDHILWGRGPGYLAALIPIVGFMALGTAAALRELEQAAPVPSGRLVETPSLRQVRDALRPAEQPVMLRWVFAGAFVTLGLVIVLAAVSVFVGRRMGIDFTLADEADVRSAGPLVLLGTGVLVAFPVAGYLIARASAAAGLLEPALSTLCALLALVVLLSLTAPVGVLFALALTPIAIGLSCGGAWLGSEH